MTNNDYFSHSGVIGMHWGQHRASRRIASAAKKSAKKTNPDDNLSPEEKAAKIEKERKDLHDKIVKSHSAKEIYSHMDMLSDEELAAAFKRLNNQQSIKNIAASQKSVGQMRIEKLTEALNTAGNVSSAAMKVYGNTAKVYNAYMTSKDPTRKPLPTL